MCICIIIFTLSSVVDLKCFRIQANPNSQNISVIADLYAEVIGVLAQSRLTLSSIDNFNDNINDLLLILSIS